MIGLTIGQEPKLDRDIDEKLCTIISELYFFNFLIDPKKTKIFFSCIDNIDLKSALNTCYFCTIDSVIQKSLQKKSNFFKCVALVESWPLIGNLKIIEQH